MRPAYSKRGFTLIELVMVIAIIGILAAIAIPRFVDLSQSARIAAARGSLGAVRSVLAIRYAQSATGGGAAAFPTSLVAGDFANGQVPVNPLVTNANSTIRAIVTTSATVNGTVSSASAGYWYMTSGQAGVYSDGTITTDTF